VNILFNRHVLEFARLEYVPAFLAFDEFNVFFAGYYADTRVLTDFLRGLTFG